MMYSELRDVVFEDAVSDNRRCCLILHLDVYLKWGHRSIIIKHHILKHHILELPKHATAAPAELGGKIRNVPRNRARTQVPPQVRKLHVYGKWHVWCLLANTAK